MGFNLFSIGKIAPTEPDEFVIAGEKEGNYYSILFGQGKVLGASLIGDTAPSRIIKRALENGDDFSDKVQAETSLQEMLLLFS